MVYLYLLTGGLTVSLAHFYLVWRHRNNRRYSLSEHAILDKQSQRIYIASHILCEVCYTLFSYNFFITQHNLWAPFYINIAFVVFDFIQAILPSRGKTEKIHFASAYISWVCYLSAGVMSLFLLEIAQPYLTLAYVLLVPILGMFGYMHVNRSKLYPYQLAVVPLFVVYMVCVAIGSK